MFNKKILVNLLLLSFISMQSVVIAAQPKAKTVDSSTHSTKISKTVIDEEARQDAYNEYTSSNLENYVEFHPLFKNGYGRRALKVINNVGNKLLVANDIDKFVRFELSRKQIVNASANFRGTIKVYNGLLDYVESEDELAYVLGHELGHVFYDDVKKMRIRNGLIIVSAVAAGTIVGANSRPADAAGAAGATALGGGLISRKISKRVEARADITGIDFMTKAGYNPMAAISMMNKILNRRWDGFSDHPSGDKRLLAAYYYIAKTYPKYLVVGYDTVSYERAMAYIEKKLAKEKQSDVKVKYHSNKDSIKPKNEKENASEIEE